MGVTTPVGRILGGRYEILRHLASGGMADVYLACSAGLEGFERHVVIKWIRAADARDRDYVRMFLDEARLAAALHHQHIVQVHDVGHDDGEYFFAMEYVHGRDARQLLTRAAARREHVPLAHVLAIASAAAAGLHYAHELVGPDRKPLGLVHRDVSPSNILIGFDGGVKVADFGIAKAAHRSAETKSGSLKGKIAYMSPEQCRGQPVDRRSDVFALGVVLYELATARRLFKTDSDFLTMTAIVAGDVPPPSRFRPDLPPPVEAMMMKALASQPDQRYQTADELRRAIQRCAAELGPAAASASLADYMTDVFGRCVEPWLTDEGGELGDDPLDDRPATETSGSGIASPLEVSLSGFDPDAPIVRARQRAITSAPAVGDDEPLFAAPRTGSGARSVPGSRRRRRVAALALALAGVAGVVLAIWFVSGGSRAAEPSQPEPPPHDVPPTAVAAPSPPPVPAPAPPAPAPPAPPAPAVAHVPAPAPVEPAKLAKSRVSKPAIAAKVRPHSSPATATKASGSQDSEWDRTELFPK